MGAPGASSARLDRGGGLAAGAELAAAAAHRWLRAGAAGHARRLCDPADAPHPAGGRKYPRPVPRPGAALSRSGGGGRPRPDRGRPAGGGGRAGRRGLGLRRPGPSRRGRPRLGGGGQAQGGHRCAGRPDPRAPQRRGGEGKPGAGGRPGGDRRASVQPGRSWRGQDLRRLPVPRRDRHARREAGQHGRVGRPLRDRGEPDDLRRPPQAAPLRGQPRTLRRLRGQDRPRRRRRLP